MNLVFKVYNKIKTKIKLLFSCLFKKKDMSFDEASLYLNNKHFNIKSSSIYNNNFSGSNAYKLSVIITVYNAEPFLEKCIDSVINQDCKYNYEIIIVNDGSTDKSGEIVNKYKNYSNIQIIHQDNQGCSSARNNGINSANGEYLMFVDSDDFLLPNCINNLLDRAIKYNADIVQGGFETLYANGKKKEEPCTNIEKKLDKSLGNLSGYPWGKVYKNNLFNNIRFPFGYWFEDSVNSNIIFCRSKKCILIPELVYCYYQNNNSQTHICHRYYKSIDSLYITESLIKDHIELNLEINQDYYEYFLRMVRLTFNRTKELDEQTIYAIFIYQYYLFNTYFNNFRTEVDSMKKIEKSLIDKKYQKYILALL